MSDVTADDLELSSPLPPEESARALAAAIDHEPSFLFSFASIWGSQPVIGRVTGSAIRLRKRIRYNNSFQTHFTGTMEPARSGTLIRGRFAMHPFTRVFMRVWFGGVLFFCVISAGTLVSQLASRSLGKGSQWVFLLILLGMLVFGLVLVRFGRYLARNEKQFLTEFLQQTLGCS